MDVACYFTMTSRPISLPVSLLFSHHHLPVAACLDLEALEEGEVSSVALEGNPARMQPTKTRSARPAGPSDLQPPQVSRESVLPVPRTTDAIVILTVLSKLQ